MKETEILEKCRACSGSHDILYYLIRRKSGTYAVICAPCNYLYRNDKDQFFGVCAYASEDNFTESARRELPFVKKLFGIPMVKTTVRREGGEVIILDNRQIRELPFRSRIDSEPRFSSPFIPAYTCFECGDVTAIIEPRAAFAELCRRDADFRSFADRLAERFEITTEQIGISGSLALGAAKADDYDIVFYGDRAELKRINGVIADINSVGGVPKVSGMPLPFRFIMEEHIVDALFVDEDPALDSLHTARQIRSDVPFRCRVTDDEFAMQVEPFLSVDGEEYSSLLIADTYFHSVIRKGDVIEGIGDILRWEHDGRTEFVMLCREPLRQIKDFTRYFYRYE